MWTFSNKRKLIHLIAVFWAVTIIYGAIFNLTGIDIFQRCWFFACGAIMHYWLLRIDKDES